jgi:hypothetical protein
MDLAETRDTLELLGVYLLFGPPLGGLGLISIGVVSDLVSGRGLASDFGPLLPYFWTVGLPAALLTALVLLLLLRLVKAPGSRLLAAALVAGIAVLMVAPLVLGGHPLSLLVSFFSFGWMFALPAAAASMLCLFITHVIIARRKRRGPR